MGNGNNGPAPSQMPGWLLPLGGLVLLLILLCCSSLALSYSRTGNINIFSGSSREFSAEELAYAQAHGGAMPRTTVSGRVVPAVDANRKESYHV